MNVVIDRLRQIRKRGVDAVRDSRLPGRHYQGYVDERSTHHIAGWLRDLQDPGERLAYEVVLPVGAGERVLQRGIADSFSDILVRVGVGDGRYAFFVRFDPPLSATERDTIFVRPVGSQHRLELAPELKISPRTRASAASAYQGYIDERSTRHVAGWVRDLGDPNRRVPFEVVLPTDGGERVLHRGRADGDSPVLRKVGVGGGAYAFYVLLNEEFSPAERDALVVRPVGSVHELELAPALRTTFEPISHLAMDIVNNCNLRCPFCVYDYANTRATQFMSEATFASALRLIPYVTDGNFWLSCLHEATLHPRLIDFITRVPDMYRRKLFYTTNLAKRMPEPYFEFLAGSGMHHLNISLESFDPAIYEMMRKGARHRIFVENWGKLLAAFAKSDAPPRLRYNLMAYRSNLREIPAIVEVLRQEKMAWQVEIRHTFDEPHIPADFREREFLSTPEWAWLADQLSRYPGEEVLLILPPGGVGYDRSDNAGTAAMISGPSARPAAASPEMADGGGDTQGAAHGPVPKPLNLSMDWDGTLRVYGEQPRGPNQPPNHVNYVMTNITYLKDPLRFLLTL